jgi:hypothetical protein
MFYYISRYEDGLVGRGSIPGRRKILLCSTASRPALGRIQPPIQWVSGALSPAVNYPGREADHLSSSSVEVKNGGTSIIPYVFMVWCLIKHRDNFTLSLYLISSFIHYKQILLPTFSFTNIFAVCLAHHSPRHKGDLFSNPLLISLSIQVPDFSNVT